MLVQLRKGQSSVPYILVPPLVLGFLPVCQQVSCELHLSGFASLYINLNMAAVDLAVRCSAYEQEELKGVRSWQSGQNPVFLCSASLGPSLSFRKDPVVVGNNSTTVDFFLKK